MQSDSSPNPSSPEPEVRLVTILFADVVGSTALTEESDAETARLVLSRCLDRISQAVADYGGTVARLMGDGLLAFFGAPEAHEDDPERAALAALRIHSAVKAYGEELGLPLQVRIGVQSGNVVMGQVGGKELSEYTAMGQPINLAARLQTAAEPGGTLLGEMTARLLPTRFKLEPVEELELKGIEGPVRAHRLVGHRDEDSTDPTQAPHAHPLVDRGRERRKLEGVVEDLPGGRGAICALIGEPGIGKNRLLDEIKSASTALPIRWAEARAYSYRQDQPYGLARDLLREQFKIHPDDSSALMDIKLEQNLGELFGEDSTEVWPFMALLLGAPVPDRLGGILENLDSEAISRRIRRAFVDTIEAMAAQRPLLLSFDDLHWADPSSLDLIESLFLSTERVPLAVVLLFRPNRERRVWDVKSQAERGFSHRYLEINLGPLDPEASQQLAANMLGADSLPDFLWSLIRDRSEGNPFFIEELVSDMLESGVLVQEGDAWKLADRTAQIRVPETLQEVIQARVDRLDRDDRTTLQTAAVIGRRFSFHLLEKLHGGQVDLLDSLLNLQRHDLIREQARVPDRVYIFKNAAIQEVAYKSLLSEQRKSLHRAAGGALEELHGDQIEEYATMIALHFARADMPDRALECYQQAGDAAYAINANLEAAEHYARALELGAARGAPPEKLQRLYLGRGRALELAADYDGALRTYRDMRNFASRQGEESIELAALMAITTLHVAPTPLFDASKGKTVGDQALELARELDDEKAEAKILWNFCILGRFTGDDQQALEYGEGSLAIARRLEMVEQIGFTLTDLYWCYLAVGDLAQAGAALAEARKIWDESGNLPMTVDNLSSSVFLHYLRGEYRQGIQASEQAWRLSQDIDNLWGKSFSLMYTGLVYMDLGQYDRGLKTMRLCERLSRDAGFMVPQIAIPLWMSVAFGDLGLPGRGLKLIDSVRARVQQELPFLEPGLLAVRAYLLALKGQTMEAKEDIENARKGIPTASTLNLLIPIASIEAEVAEASGDRDLALTQLESALRFLERADTPPLVADALYLKGRALLQQGDIQGAKRSAMAALTRLQGISARRILWQIFALMKDIELALGDRPQAAKYTEKSATLIRYIAHHAGEEELRTAFLQQERVRALLES